MGKKDNKEKTEETVVTKVEATPEVVSVVEQPVAEVKAEEGDSATPETESPNPPQVTVDELQGKVEKLSQENKDLNSAIEFALQEKNSLISQISDLEKRVAFLSIPVEKVQNEMQDNTVCLDGVVYTIIHRNMVKELLEDFKKRLVPEDHTAVVINKIGG